MLRSVAKIAHSQEEAQIALRLTGPVHEFIRCCKQCDRRGVDDGLPRFQTRMNAHAMAGLMRRQGWSGRGTERRVLLIGTRRKDHEREPTFMPIFHYESRLSFLFSASRAHLTKFLRTIRLRHGCQRLITSSCLTHFQMSPAHLARET